MKTFQILFKFGVGLVFLLGCTLLLWSDISSLLKLSASHVVHIYGIVTYLSAEDNDEFSSHLYHVQYRYQASLPSGGTQEFNGSSNSISWKEYSSLHVDQPIFIAYASGDPALSWLGSENPPTDRPLGIWGGNGIVGIGYLGAAIARRLPNPP